MPLSTFPNPGFRKLRINALSKRLISNTTMNSSRLGGVALLEELVDGHSLAHMDVGLTYVVLVFLVQETQWSQCCSPLPIVKFRKSSCNHAAWKDIDLVLRMAFGLTLWFLRSSADSAGQGLGTACARK